MYKCTVCGYSKLRHPPDDYIICPSCGTEFGYTDFSKNHGQLRSEWIRKGMRWHSRVIPKPPDWNPIEQLRQAGYLRDLYTLTGRGAYVQVSASHHAVSEGSLVSGTIKV